MARQKKEQPTTRVLAIRRWLIAAGVLGFAACAIWAVMTNATRVRQELLKPRTPFSLVKAKGIRTVRNFSFFEKNPPIDVYYANSVGVAFFRTNDYVIFAEHDGVIIDVWENPGKDWQDRVLAIEGWGVPLCLDLEAPNIP